MTAGDLSVGSSSPSLVLDADAMRKLGYATVDFVVDYLTRRERTPLRRAARGHTPVHAQAAQRGQSGRFGSTSA